MDAELKTKWLEALRLGNYQQGQGVLKDDRQQFCCLGVLMDIQGYDWSELSKSELKSSYIIDERYRAGLDSIDTVLLSNMNDDGKTFTQIADYIEHRY